MTRKRKDGTMKNLPRKFAIATILILLAGTGFVATLLTDPVSADAKNEVLIAHEKAMGGAEAIGKLKNISRSGTAEMGGVFGEMSGTVTESIVFGKKYHQHMDLDGYYETSAWNGKTAWSKNPLDGESPVEGEDLEFFTMQATVSMLHSIWKQYGAFAFKSQPDVTYEGREYHVLELDTGDMTFYIDKETKLLGGITVPFEDPELGESEMTLYYDDYNEYEGVQIADTVGMDIGEGIIEIEMRYSDTKVNTKIDDKIFEKQ